MSYTPFYPGGFEDDPLESTPINKDFLNQLEAAMAAVHGDAEGAIPDPAGKAANEALVWDGDSWEAVKITGVMIAAAAEIQRSQLADVFPITDNDIDPAAGILRSKLDFGAGLTNADIAVGAAIAKAKLDLALQIGNAEIATAAAIAYSKLNLAGSIVNADVATAAGIVLSKLGQSAAAVGDGPAWSGSVWEPRGTMVQLGEIMLESAAATIDLTSIPGTYSHLLLIVHGRSDAATTIVANQVRFNGDTGANYDRQQMSGQGAAAAAAEAFGATNITVGQFPGATAGANLFGSNWILIPHYATAAHNKTLLALASVKIGVTANQMITYGTSGFWRSNVAITQITLSPASGSYVAGSMATLYGLG